MPLGLRAARPAAPPDNGGRKSARRWAISGEIMSNPAWKWPLSSVARLLRQSAAFLAVWSHGNEGGTISATGKRFLFPLSPRVPHRAAWVPVVERWAVKLAARPAFPGRPAIFSTVSLSAWRARPCPCSAPCSIAYLPKAGHRRAGAREGGCVVVS